MKFEGEHRNIPLHGIERNATNMVAQDGAMNEVIGMIPRNGSFIAYAPTDIGMNKTNDVVMVRVHHTSTGDNVITVKENNYLINGKDACEQIIVNNYEVWVGNGRCGEQILETRTQESTVYKARTVLDIVFVGNRMDILTKENGIEHWLWKNGKYENVDDLAGYSNDGKPLLPSVDFKVRRGIYNGTKVYPSARYIKVHKAYTDSDTAQENKSAASSYVRGLGSVGSDILALLDSVRYMGGITGYILVAAAYRRKGGDPSNPQYMMASPIMLMGAPEIYMKDSLYENNTGLGEQYIAKPSGTHMLDMFTYNNKSNGGESAQEAAFDKIWAFQDTDDRDIADLAEGENVNIELQTNSDPCVIRKITGTSKKSYTESYKADDAIDVSTSKQNIQQPALYCQKFALYNHGNSCGTIDREAEYRGFRVSHASANVLSFRVNGDILEEYRDEIDRLCIFISPIISPYKHSDDVGVVMKSDYAGSKKDKYDGFFFCEKTCSANYKMNKSACGGSFTPEMKSDSEIRKNIEDIAGLYKVEEIQFDNLKPGQWVDLNLSNGKLESDRLVQHSDTMLKVSDLQPVSIVTGGIFGYNERLHVYNFQKSEVYRLPYSCLQYFNGGGQYRVPDDGTQQYEYAVEVRDHNDSLVVSRFDSFCAAINPLVSYADIEAKGIRVVKRCKKNGKFYVGSKDFVPFEFGGVASGYINTNLKPINIDMKEVNVRQYDGAFRSDKIESDSNAYGKNEMRVSKPGLIEFELDKSYKVGNGEIKALARLTMGLSQDNYGKYPLVVFTTDGIYTLDVDSTGAGAYNIQSPLSRLVCTNPNGICEIDGAVLFPTEYGLHMVTVDGVKPVALQANGTPCNPPEASAGLEVYRNAINHKKIVKLLGDISYQDFLAYINSYSDEDSKYGARYGTHIRFLHAINSVVVYNRNMPYSYMIELSTWTVTKLEQRIMFDDNDFPKQTFWIEPNNENNVAIMEEVTTTETDGEEEIETTVTKWTDLVDYRTKIDGDELLQNHLGLTIGQAITDKLADVNSELTRLSGEISSLALSEADYRNTSDSVFIASDTTKATVLAALEQERQTLIEKHEQLNTQKVQLAAANAVNYNSLELEEVEEAKLEAVGLQSVGKQLNDRQRKNALASLKEKLVDEEMSKTCGTVNKTVMRARLGAGKLTLTRTEGKWTKGSRTFTSEQLAEVGLNVATEAADGMKYQIVTTNNNLTAVQFDYLTGLDNVQCLLQTRPIKLETTHMKSAFRVVLRGAFEKTNDDTVITSENDNKFNIINMGALADYCDGKDVTLYYRNRERITLHTNKAGMVFEKKTHSWQWETEDGEKVKLKDIGLQQAGSITKEDTIVIAPKIHFAGLYVFGSYDGNHWMLLGAEEKLLSSNRFHDIGCRTHRDSVRYLMVVFAATLSQDSHVDGLEITSDVKYNDKLK